LDQFCCHARTKTRQCSLFRKKAEDDTGHRPTQGWVFSCVHACTCKVTALILLPAGTRTHKNATVFIVQEESGRPESVLSVHASSVWSTPADDTGHRPTQGWVFSCVHACTCKVTALILLPAGIQYLIWTSFAVTHAQKRDSVHCSGRKRKTGICT
jgi:hypothetical protein